MDPTHGKQTDIKLEFTVFSVFESSTLPCWSVLLPPSLPSPLHAFWLDVLTILTFHHPYHFQDLLPLLPPLPHHSSQHCIAATLKYGNKYLYSLAWPTGCVPWFLLCLYWRWRSECWTSLFLLKLSPKGTEHNVGQTDAIVVNSTDNWDIICNFVWYICSVPIFL